MSSRGRQREGVDAGFSPSRWRTVRQGCRRILLRHAVLASQLGLATHNGKGGQRRANEEVGLCMLGNSTAATQSVVGAWGRLPGGRACTRAARGGAAPWLPPPVASPSHAHYRPTYNIEIDVLAGWNSQNYFLLFYFTTLKLINYIIK
jgi:hypothetical protein